MQCVFRARGCQANEPVGKSGAVIIASWRCRHFTCTDGLRKAREALIAGAGEESVRVGQERVMAIPFGSIEKPFAIIERFVVSQGEHRGQIITTRMNGERIFSPGHVPGYREKDYN